MENFQISPGKLQELRREHKKACEKWVADRIKVVFLLGSGRTVAEVVMLDENTVRDYFQTWKSGEIQGLTQRHYRGRIARLCAEQKSEDVLRHIQKSYELHL